MKALIQKYSGSQGLVATICPKDLPSGQLLKQSHTGHLPDGSLADRDLPLKINFWNSALRAEIKATKPLIRNSEFLWQEGHTVHESCEDAQKEVNLILRLYKKLIEEYLAIPVRQGLKSRQEKFVGAVSTASLESLMGDGRALQMATSHHLGQNFSKPFEIKYLGRDNSEHYAWQTSWGTSWRLIGAVAMIHGDNKGLIMPPKIAPIQVIIIPIHKKADEGLVKEHTRYVLEELKRAKSELKLTKEMNTLLDGSSMIGK